jgi:hypothetical protein
MTSSFNIKKGLVSTLTCFILGCDSRSSTIEFCGRFYANATTKQEDFAFAKDKKLSPELIPKKEYKSNENPVIHGRDDFNEYECGFAWFPSIEKYNYKECLPEDFYPKTRNNIRSYCDYFSRVSENKG